MWGFLFVRFKNLPALTGGKVNRKLMKIQIVYIYMLLKTFI